MARCAAYDAVATATMPGKFSVNSWMGDGRMLKGSIAISYAPEYSCTNISAGSYVVLRKVTHPGTDQAATSVVSVCAADARGTFNFSMDSEDPSNLRFLHTLYNANGDQYGETLEADVAFAYTGPYSPELTVDSRTNSLESLTLAGATLPLAYDSLWCTSGVLARLELSCVRERFKGAVRVDCVSNVFFSVVAPADGDCACAVNLGIGGTFTYRLAFLDSSGVMLGDPLLAVCRIKERWGTILQFR